MGQTVNLLTSSSEVRILLSPRLLILNRSLRSKSESSSIGRAPAFQAGGCGFETRLSLLSCKRKVESEKRLWRLVITV